MTARTSSIRSSSVGKVPSRSDRPVPRLSNRMRRLNALRRERKCDQVGLIPVMVEVRDEAGHENQIQRPLADDLIGYAEIAALGVMRLDHRAPSTPDRPRCLANKLCGSREGFSLFARWCQYGSAARAECSFSTPARF